MPDPLIYTGAGLDRATERRHDDAWLAERLNHRDTRIIPVWRGHSLIGPGEAPGAITITGAHARGMLQIADTVALLGINGAHAYFAADLSAHEGPVLSPMVGRGEFVDLRSVGALMEAQEAALLAYARGMIHWHQRQRYCGDCGTPESILNCRKPSWWLWWTSRKRRPDKSPPATAVAPINDMRMSSTQ